MQRAKASAGGMLLRRPHSEAELRAKLTDRGHPQAATDAAIARLQELARAQCAPHREVSPCHVCERPATRPYLPGNCSPHGRRRNVYRSSAVNVSPILWRPYELSLVGSLACVPRRSVSS